MKSLANLEASKNLQQCRQESDGSARNPAGHDTSDSDGDGMYIPYVRHTFLNRGPPLHSRRRALPRSHSATVTSSCDRYATEVHALMFKICPVSKQQDPVVVENLAIQSSPSTPEMIANAGRRKVGELEKDSGMHGLQWEGTPSTASESETVSSGVETLVTNTSEDWMSRQVKVSTEEPLESVLARVQCDELGRPTSLGSEGHMLGECRPCAYFGSENRPCINGVRCPFCHFSHPSKRRVRLCRRKRLEMRAAVATAVAEAGAEGIKYPPRYLPISWPCTGAVDT